MRRVVEDSTYAWFLKLTPAQQKAVTRWLELNAPPTQWAFSPRAWAMLEMPFRFGVWRFWLVW